MGQSNLRGILLLRNLLFLFIIMAELLLALHVFAASFSDSVTIGAAGPADSKAQLDVRSTTKGVLLPRMTTTQQNAISSPTEGLLIYDTVLHQLSNFNGTTWTAVGGTPSAATTSTLGTVKALGAVSHQFLTGITSGTGVPTQAQPAFSDISGTLGISAGGTGQTSKSAAFDALAPCTSGAGIITYGSSTNSCLATTLGDVGKPLVSAGSVSAPTFQTLGVTGGGTGLSSATLGDLWYSSAANTMSALAGNATATKKFLSQTGTGSVSAAPIWAQPACADLSNAAASCSTDATNATNISTGTLSQSRGGTGVSNGGTLTWGSNNITFTTGGATSVTLPPAGLLATTAIAETWTNKTLTSPVINGANITMGTASNSNRIGLPTNSTTNLASLTNTAGDIAYDTTQGKVVYNNGTAWQTVGTNSNGVKNYLGTYNANGTITNNNGDFETGSFTSPAVWGLGHVTLTSNVPSGTPTFGSGASANLSLAIYASGFAPLAGGASLKYESTTATTAGDFLYSPTFGLDTEDVVAPMWFSFVYNSSSPLNPGNINFSGSSSNSFGVYIYDVSAGGATWIVPSGTSSNSPIWCMNLSSTTGRCVGSFTPVGSDKFYKLVIFNANATAGAAGIVFDDFQVSRTPVVPGAIQSGTTAFTVTSSWTSNITWQGFYNRHGDLLDADYYGTITGAVNAVQLSVNLPSGLSLDTSKIGTNFNGSSDRDFFGTVQILRNASQVYGTGRMAFSGTTSTLVGMYLLTTSGTNPVSISDNGAITNTAPATWANGDYVHIRITNVPISGWTAGAQLSTAETIFQTPAPTSVVSSAKTPTASGNWNAMSGNSLVLTTGTWRLSGSCVYNNSGTSPSYTMYDCAWFGANGADSATVPATLSTVSGLTVYTNLLENYVNLTGGATVANAYPPAPTAIVKCAAATCTVYLDTFQSATTIANARVTVYPQAEKIPDFTVFSTYGTFELKTITSNTASPAGSSVWHVMSGNSLTLTPGTWRLFGHCLFGNTGSSPAYNQDACTWMGANGTGTGTNPAALSTVATILSSPQAQTYKAYTTGAWSDDWVEPPEMIIQCTSSCTVYLDAYSTQTTTANARITNSLNAQRLQ